MRAFILILILGALSAVAESVQTIKVKGMVCELCAQGVKKKFLAEPEVKNVKVLVKKQIVEIEYKDPKVTLSEERLKALLEDAGYELNL